MNSKFVFLVCVLLTFFTTNIVCQETDRIKTVVIDAGHGGHDPGCIGYKKTKEKDVVLAVALKTGQLIKQTYPDVKIIYTRKTDVFVELYRRAEIANNNKANLFISIHCNASENRTAHGIETFVMGVDKSEASMAIAKRENSVILLENNYKTNYGGFDPNSAEASVLGSLYSSSYLKNSAIFAAKVQNHLLRTTHLTDRQVRQAGYWVLYKVAMPSILVELGFLSNPQEEQYLIKKNSQDLIATSICNAVIEYKNNMEGAHKAFLPINTNPSVNQPINDAEIPDTHSSAVTPPHPSPTDNTSVKPTENPSSSQPDTSELHFRVQFFASKENLSTADKRFANLPEVMKYFENNYWKYTAGNTSKYADITLILNKIHKQYPDAFVVAFKGNTKIPLSEAKKLEKSN